MIKNPNLQEATNRLFTKRVVELNPGQPETNTNQEPVYRKSRNLTGHFRVSQFPLYLKNGEHLSRQTSQSVCFLLP